MDLCRVGYGVCGGDAVVDFLGYLRTRAAASCVYKESYGISTPKITNKTVVMDECLNFLFCIQ